MKIRSRFLGASAGFLLILLTLNHAQSFPVTYTYIGNNYESTNAPCLAGFTLNDHVMITITFDSIFWGQEVNHPPDSYGVIRSGPWEVGCDAFRVTTDISGTIIAWNLAGAIGGLDIASGAVGNPDGSGIDDIFGDRPSSGQEFYGALVRYGVGSRAPGQGWTMEISTPTPTPAVEPTPTPVPTPTPSPALPHCVLRSSYWMNHPESWCFETIHIAGVTYTQAEAIALMRHNSGHDKTYSLIQTLIAARLNLGCQESPSDNLIDGGIVVSDNFLCHYPIGSGVRANSPEWRYIKNTYQRLVRYNSGLGAAPRCQADDFPESDLSLSAVEDQ